jgi:Concanavalin A-like lectin/glucanases superfamily
MTAIAASMVFSAEHATHAAPSSFQAQIASGDPLLWYQLSEATGNAHNFGSLGATFDASFFGTPQRAAPTIAGDTGIGFDSSDDYLESLGVSTLTGNPTFSIETLIYLPAGGSANLWGPFLHWGDGGGADGSSQRNGREVYFSAQNANLDRTYAGFYNAGLRTASPVPLGKWLDIVWTRQGGNDTASGTNLYINGNSVPLEQDPNLTPGLLAAGGIDVTATTFRINRARDYIGTRQFTGTMDEIALYDRVLSATEVRDHACSIDELCFTPGDYNEDGTVNAADYTVWRNNLGGLTSLPNDDTPGVGPDDYDRWKSHFGESMGSGSGAASSAGAVPEPSGIVILLGPLILGQFLGRRRST